MKLEMAKTLRRYANELYKPDPNICHSEMAAHLNMIADFLAIESRNDQSKGGNPGFGLSISDKAKADIEKIDRAAKRF